MYILSKLANLIFFLSAEAGSNRLRLPVAASGDATPLASRDVLFN